VPKHQKLQHLLTPKRNSRRCFLTFSIVLSLATACLVSLSWVIGLTGSASARYRQLVLITLTDHLLWFTWNYQITFFRKLNTWEMFVVMLSRAWLWWFTCSVLLGIIIFFLFTTFWTLIIISARPTETDNQGPIFGPARYPREYRTWWSPILSLRGYKHNGTICFGMALTGFGRKLRHTLILAE